MRKSLEMLIESASLPVQVHDSAEDLLSHANLHEPGCIVLDLRMPGMSGIELLQRLREEMIDIPVIIISGHADVPTAVRGMKLGAVDVLQKPVEATVLIEAIRRSLDLSVALHRRHLSDLSVRQRFAGLTPRQLELLRLVVDGKSNKQIAIAMGISVKTVANHRASLMTRTGATNAAELARLYTIADAASADVRPPRDL
jgi:FixJ family two-component response regulator